MPRALWSGAIRFGLINIPVKLFTAVREHEVRFRQLHRQDGGRIRYQRICELDGEEVPNEDIVKGYEFSKGEYVTVTEDELQTLAAEARRSIDLEAFVDLSQIDPIYFASTYHLATDAVTAPAYALLAQAMRDEGKVALGRVVLRNRERPCAIRPTGAGLVLNLLHHPEELVAAPGAVLDREGALPAPGKKEREMAQALIGNLTGDFEPERYQDTYREQVLELVRKKVEGEEIVSHAPPVERTGKVVDLMAALEQSLKAQREADGTSGTGHTRGERRAPQRKAARRTRSKKASR